MPQDSKSIYAILGLLSFKSMSGYDIKKWINEGLRFFWNLSYGQIYPTLNEMSEKGLVTYAVEKKGNRPERKTYSITEEGLKVLQDWLIRPLSFTSANGNEMLLKLFFGAQIPDQILVAHITDYQRHCQNILDELHKTEQQIKMDSAEDKSRFYRLNAIAHGIAECEALVRWCDSTKLSFGSPKV